MLIKMITENPWIMIIIVLLWVGFENQHRPHYPADYYEQTSISTGNFKS